MNAPAVKRMTVPEFLAWAKVQDSGRFELVCGQIVAMAPERWEHVQAKQRAFRALEAAVERAGVACQALIDGLAVAVDDETSYIPDALVNCGEPGAPDSLVAPDPVVVVEVLSPSAHYIDTAVKLADFFRVPSLKHRLIVDLGRQHVVHYRKQLDGTATVVVMSEGEIAFDPPGISVAVASFLG
jgi:Uma2 family endonuclease